MKPFAVGLLMSSELSTAAPCYWILPQLLALSTALPFALVIIGEYGSEQMKIGDDVAS